MGFGGCKSREQTAEERREIEKRIKRDELKEKLKQIKEKYVYLTKEYPAFNGGIDPHTKYLIGQNNNDFTIWYNDRKDAIKTLENLYWLTEDIPDLSIKTGTKRGDINSVICKNVEELHMRLKYLEIIRELRDDIIQVAVSGGNLLELLK